MIHSITDNSFSALGFDDTLTHPDNTRFYSSRMIFLTCRKLLPTNLNRKTGRKITNRNRQDKDTKSDIKDSTTSEAKLEKAEDDTFTASVSTDRLQKMGNLCAFMNSILRP